MAPWWWAFSATIDISHPINRILDCTVFDSGGLDKELFLSRSDVIGRKQDWFQRRRISYHHEAERGMVSLQFSSSLSPPLLLASSRTDGGGDESASVVEQCETDDLRGMLFMFSVSYKFPCV
ncbi:putative ovule protein [Cocos nucifera]|uniref:Nonsense-mediated mRNA decay factor SMG8 n=1 Tax=Cocos nucifera TaxID=13894 RepID=A0A8K0N7H7_COCNU|nr:putative ovule protein [Cocos nucifera]